ncbi:MAG: TonB-dependent receptor, partial [Bacteroidales bacterium]|nr:TonB-dependent receptor [Bacteroidales bacterium]
DNIVLGNYVPDSNWGKVDIPSLGRGQSVLQKMIGNPELTWEIAYKQNYGIDMQFFRQFSLSVDYFREDRNNVLIQRGTVPTLQGIPLSSYPKVNYGQIMNNGFEVDATWQTNFPFGLSMMIKGNFAYNKNKQVFMDEPKLSEDYYARYRKTGYSINQCFGYEIDYSSGCGNGFINTEEELERAKEMYKIGTPRLGDFLYKDLNGAGFIDEKDITAIGYSNIPQITYGFSGSLSWKNFDFSFQFAGIARASRAYTSWLATEIGTDGFYTDYMLNAWTPQRYANGEKIEYPALSTVPGVSHIANSFFIMDRSFLRLKTVELGYTLPHRLLSKISMSELRVYISGNNLLTWKKIDNKAIDPEVSWEANYPLTKMINIGVNIGF